MRAARSATERCRFNDVALILRQQVRTNYEKPFVLLQFGSHKALLLNTVVVGLDVVARFDSIMQAWRALARSVSRVSMRLRAPLTTAAHSARRSLHCVGTLRER